MKKSLFFKVVKKLTKKNKKIHLVHLYFYYNLSQLFTKPELTISNVFD